MEGLIYGGTFAVQKSIRLAYSWKEFYLFFLFYFVFEDTVFMYKPPGAYIRRGHLTKRFLRYVFDGLIFGGAYTWRGLFSEFYGYLSSS